VCLPCLLACCSRSPTDPVTAPPWLALNRSRSETCRSPAWHTHQPASQQPKLSERAWCPWSSRPADCPTLHAHWLKEPYPSQPLNGQGTPVWSRSRQKTGCRVLFDDGNLVDEPAHWARTPFSKIPPKQGMAHPQKRTHIITGAVAGMREDKKWQGRHATPALPWPWLRFCECEQRPAGMGVGPLLPWLFHFHAVLPASHFMSHFPPLLSARYCLADLCSLDIYYCHGSIKRIPRKLLCEAVSLKMIPICCGTTRIPRRNPSNRQGLAAWRAK